MPSIIEQIPKKGINVVVKSFQYCSKKIKYFLAKLQEQEAKRKWGQFIEYTKSELTMLVKEQLEDDQFSFILQPVFEEQVIESNGVKSVQKIHVADERVPLCTLDVTGKDFNNSIVFRFDIFGDIEEDRLLKLKELWLYYLKVGNGQYNLHGTADMYKHNGLRHLVFLIYDKPNERSVKLALFELKHYSS